MTQHTQEAAAMQKLYEEIDQLEEIIRQNTPHNSVRGSEVSRLRDARRIVRDNPGAARAMLGVTRANARKRRIDV